MFVFYKFHCSFKINALLFFYDEETLQKKEVEILWTVGLQTLTLPLVDGLIRDAVFYDMLANRI